MSDEKKKNLSYVLNLAIKKDYSKAKKQLLDIERSELSASSKNTYDKISKILTKIKESSRSRKQNNSELERTNKEKNKVSSSLVYCILAMEHEADVLKMTVSPLIQQLSSLDAIYILFNGFKDHALKTHFEKHTGIHVLESSANLGVAGGRNLLYKESFNDESSFDYVVTLDNDVIVPNDFNGIIKRELDVNYSQNNIGILGSVILDYKKQKVKSFVENGFLCFPGYLSASNYNLFTDDIKMFVKSNVSKLETILWHIGIDKDYQAAYVHRKDLYQSFSDTKQTFFPFLAHAPSNSKLISQKLFEVSNVPGCFQVVSTKNLKKAGFLDNRFSPYFFEDSEFSIRLMKMGMKNYISTNITLFHGTDNRHLDRKKVSSKFEFVANEYRARIILLDKLCVDNPIKKLVVQSIQRYSLENSSTKALPEFVASLVGIRRGMIQIGIADTLEDNQHEFDDTFNKVVDDFLNTNDVNETVSSLITFNSSLPPADKGLPQVYFSQLKKFRNIYESQDCLIVCNGPSLKDTNLGLFAGMPTFCVNSTFILQEKLGFTPDFFTVEDNHVIDDNLNDILKMKSGVKFFPDKYREKFGDLDNVYYLPTIWDCYWKSKLSHENPEFSEDIARGIYTGQTVTYLNLQIAYYLGFKRVFIVGLDFSYSIPKGSKIDNNSIDHDDDDPNHFHASYFGKGRQWHFPKLDSCMNSYSIAKERFERSGREVIDLTKNGCLNVFRKSTVEKELNIVGVPKSVGKGLDFKQYFLDMVYTKYKKINFTVHEDKHYSSVSMQHIHYWLYSRFSDFSHSLIEAIQKKENTQVVAYLDEKIFVSSDMIDCTTLPFCDWLSSQVNVKYAELPNFRLDSAKYLAKDYVLFLPNNSQGVKYLKEAITELREIKTIVYSDLEKILIKCIN